MIATMRLLKAGVFAALNGELSAIDEFVDVVRQELNMAIAIHRLGAARVLAAQGVAAQAVAGAARALHVGVADRSALGTVRGPVSMNAQRPHVRRGNAPRTIDFRIAFGVAAER